MNDEYLSESQKTKFTEFDKPYIIENGRKIEIPVTPSSSFSYPIEPHFLSRERIQVPKSYQLFKGNENQFTYDVSNFVNYPCRFGHSVIGPCSRVTAPYRNIDPLYYYPRVKKVSKVRRIFNILKQ